jgi:hypothetical protein
VIVANSRNVLFIERNLRTFAPFDSFGYTAVRRIERRPSEEYRVLTAQVLETLSQANLAVAWKSQGLPPI